MLAGFCILLTCSVGSAQSLVVSSGSDTIAFSSRLSGVESSVATLQNDVAGIRSDVTEIKTSIKSISSDTVAQTQPAIVTVAKAKRREWYLVSESWCQNCPAAKRRFRSLGWPESNILTIAECERRFGFRPGHVPFEFGDPFWQSETTVVEKPRKTVTTTTTQQVRQRLPVVSTQWGTIDLETYSRNCNCPMCQGIRSLQQSYRQGLYSVPAEVIEPVKPEQEPTPPDVSAAMLDLMPLTADDLLADVGCGNGSLLIDAVRRFGCRGIGFEIDPVKADEARRRVKDSGLSSSIDIITGDALICFQPKQQGITACITYLYPELLEKLAPKIAECRVSASPFHEIPGLGMAQIGDVWIRVQK
jgi:hypothetical protein